MDGTSFVEMEIHSACRVRKEVEKLLGGFIILLFQYDALFDFLFSNITDEVP
jgi:hypothetical protein